MTFDNDEEQYLVAAQLRPSKAPAKEGMRGLRIRIDAGLRGGELLSSLQSACVQVVLCLGSYKLRVLQVDLKPQQRTDNRFSASGKSLKSGQKPKAKLYKALPPV